MKQSCQSRSEWEKATHLEFGSLSVIKHNNDELFEKLKVYTPEYNNTIYPYTN